MIIVMLDGGWGFFFLACSSTHPLGNMYSLWGIITISFLSSIAIMIDHFLALKEKNKINAFPLQQSLSLIIKPF